MGFFKLAIIFLAAGFLLVNCSSGKDWRSASRASAGIAPDPAVTHEAVLQVYGARAWGWRGWFAIHTWVAAKRTGEDSYLVYDVVGWRAKRGQPVMRIARDVPDRYWFDAEPQVLAEHRGDGVDQLIDAVDQAARDYPWKETYKVFPGPNSNTFTAWVGKEVPRTGTGSAVSSLSVAVMPIEWPKSMIALSRGLCGRPGPGNSNVLTGSTEPDKIHQSGHKPHDQQVMPVQGKDCPGF